MNHIGDTQQALRDLRAMTHIDLEATWYTTDYTADGTPIAVIEIYRSEDESDAAWAAHGAAASPSTSTESTPQIPAALATLRIALGAGARSRMADAVRDNAGALAAAARKPGILL